MTRNQKIALGCGGAGCLGLIVVGIAVALIFYFSTSGGLFSYSGSGTNRNSSSNRNSNSSNSNDDTINSNDNDNSSSSSSSSSSSASSLSDDDKHKLYHAALMTGDQQLIQRVSVKMGLLNEDFTPGAKWEEFITNHVGWVLRNASFIKSINTEEKAREYVNNNFPE
ncbi:MAG TPA: hypothetical protein VFY60_00790 [Pyrinomonadaceae bacterium]|nr:hypothetical protein [Pyrinomonadaceae bacterium]